MIPNRISYLGETYIRVEATRIKKNYFGAFIHSKPLHLEIIAPEWLRSKFVGRIKVGGIMRPLDELYAFLNKSLKNVRNIAVKNPAAIKLLRKIFASVKVAKSRGVKLCAISFVVDVFDERGLAFTRGHEHAHVLNAMYKWKENVLTKPILSAVYKILVKKHPSLKSVPRQKIWDESSYGDEDEYIFDSLIDYRFMGGIIGRIKLPKAALREYSKDVFEEYGSDIGYSRVLNELLADLAGYEALRASGFKMTVIYDWDTNRVKKAIGVGYSPQALKTIIRSGWTYKKLIKALLNPVDIAKAIDSRVWQLGEAEEED